MIARIHTVWLVSTVFSIWEAAPELAGGNGVVDFRTPRRSAAAIQT
jgi:hypothetical protein